MSRHLLSILLTVALTSLACAQQVVVNQTALPPDNAYVVVKDGHLTLDGQRQRYWGAIGNFPGAAETVDGDVHWGQRQVVKRLKDMGFNMVRFWHYGPDEKYVKGDGSRRDRVDFFFAECQRQGIKIWAAGLGGGEFYEDEVDKYVKMIDEPATEAAWKEAVSSMMKKDWRSPNKGAIRPTYALAGIWDARLELATIAALKSDAQHFNQHTGLRYSDDPVNAVWELTNEQWFVPNMVRGKWMKLPEFFKRSLLEKWHGFLKDKYKTDAALTEAWGFLMKGESLEKGSVLLAPLAKAGKPASFNDTNPEAIKAFTGAVHAVGPDDFTAARSADVLEFFTGLLLSHKQRLSAELKTWGKSCQLSPVLFDTGIGESIQSQYVQQFADAISHCAYMEGYSPENDKTDPDYPFYTVLDQYPRLGNDTPWLEHNRTPGKPFLCYETQMGNPGKYRAEFPFRLAALASIQDWDAACFHYWTIGKYKFSDPKSLEGGLSFPGPSANQYDYTYDEVAFAARRIAGEIFRFGHAKPPENPTVFTFGRKALYSTDSMNYGQSYGPGMLQDMLYTTYRYGMRLVIDPSVEGDSIQGKKVRADSYLVPSVIKPTDGIEFDTHKRQLVFDTPGAVSYVGFLADHGSDTLKFKHGVTVSDIVFNNPEGSPYPVRDNEKFLAFGLVATEVAQPLDKTKSASLVLVSTSFNTGLNLTAEKPAMGKAPVLVTRVGGTVKCDAINGMSYVMRDYHMNELAKGVVKDGVIVISADKPVFVVELTRP